MFSLLLHHPHTPSTSLSLFTSLRHMGGGPRTFPGGLNKWQWKRLHEKKAKEKEKNLLSQEKQLYQARIRSSIRAELSKTDNVSSADVTHGPRSTEDHIKALADRFMKEGAEDLWNERDGSVKNGPVVCNRPICDPIDIRKLGCKGNVGSGSDLGFTDGFKSRGYSSYPTDLNRGFSTRSYSSCSMNLNHGFGTKSYSSYSTSLNDGFSTMSYSSYSTDLNYGYSTRSYSSCSMSLNDGFMLKSTDFVTESVVSGENVGPSSASSLSDGFKLKSKSFLSKSVKSMNLYDGIKLGHCSVCSMDSNDGNRPRHYFSCSRNLNDGFKLKSRAFLIESVNLMDSNDGFKPRHYCAYGSIGKMGYGFNPRSYLTFPVNLNGGITNRHYSGSAQTKGRKRSRFNFSDESTSDEESEGEKEESKNGSDRRFTSSAALGKYDKKKTRRVPLKFLDDEEDLSQRVEAIRNEVKQRSMVQIAVDTKEEDSILSQKRFDECNVSPLTVKALTQAGYVQMTRVQEATLSVCLEGNDALVKAKSGTGKSAAFLLPAIETVLKALNSKKKERAPPVYVLILCPMRELASQIAAEANVMLKYHEGIGVQTLVGGTRFKVDQKLLESNQSQIVVATPGRLLDHIESKSGISVRLLGLKMLILDEADHLLDLGFRKDIEKIVDCLPRERQCLLFSATVPKEVRRISQLVLKREHAYIDTVGLDCVETPTKVQQFKMVAPHDQHFQMVYHLLNEHISQTPDYKVIVFCTTAMVTSLMFLLLREFKMNVSEIHSRKPQIYRTRVSEEFKEAKRQILISSDVSARGMNYPDVTLVIQVGIPSDREQYIHRLGRTGREGKGGEGILLLAPWEEYFLDDIKDLPLANIPVPHLNLDLKTKVEQSMVKIDPTARESAYHAWLGYYNSIGEIGRDKTTLVELANQFGQSIGLEKPPSLFRKTALKMGLRDIPGIRIRK